MPTLPPSPLTSLSPPSTGERLARCMAPAALPLPPLPPSSYPPPLVDRRDDILESEQPPHKRLYLATLGFRYEVGESSTRGQGVDYGFTDTVEAEMRHQGIREVGYGIRDIWIDSAEAVPDIASTTSEKVNTRVVEFAELHEHDTQELYALLEDAQDSRTHILQQTQQQLHETHSQMQQTEMAGLRETDRLRQSQIVETLRVMRDMRREMGDMQAELVALCGQPRRAGQPAGDIRVPNHQDALGMLIVTSRDLCCFILLGHYTCIQIVAPVTRQEHNPPPPNTNTPPHHMNPESVHAMIDQALLRNSTNGDGSQSVVGLTRWIEKMKFVFNTSGCAIENQVKFTTCTLLDAALTLWNGQIRTLGPEAYAMTWEVLKKKMMDKYCLQGELKKLEIELWNMKVKGNDVPTYTNRFQELTLICTKFVANENEKIDKYISGLPDKIYGNVKSSKPRTLDETIELTNDLMDQKLRTYVDRADNKRKTDDTSRNNHGHQQQPFKKQNVTKVYNMGTGERKPYEGSFPKGTKCQRHHNGSYTQKCHKCNKVGHFARDCRSSGNANVANAQRDGKETPKGNGCFEYGASGHFKRDCPKLKNKNRGIRNAQGWVYVVGNAEKQECTHEPELKCRHGKGVCLNHSGELLCSYGFFMVGCCFKMDRDWEFFWDYKSSIGFIFLEESLCVCVWCSSNCFDYWEKRSLDGGFEDFQVSAPFFVIRSIQSQVKSGDDASFLEDDSSVDHHPGGRHVYIRISLMRKEVQKKTHASCLISLKGCLFGREQKSFIYKLEYSSRSPKIFSRILFCMSIIFLFACRERCNQFTCDAILEGDC
nr:hypothetical protein [Tanacetum cinerariifolium]